MSIYFITIQYTQRSSRYVHGMTDTSPQARHTARLVVCCRRLACIGPACCRVSRAFSACCCAFSTRSTPPPPSMAYDLSILNAYIKCAWQGARCSVLSVGCGEGMQARVRVACRVAGTCVPCACACACRMSCNVVLLMETVLCKGAVARALSC